MDVKKYAWEIISTILSFIAISILFYFTYYAPLVDYTEELKELKKEYNKITKDYIDFKLPPKVIENNNSDTTVYKFLSNLNAIYENIEVTSIAPSLQNQYEIKFASNYSDFLNILANIEKYNTNINSFSINPYEMDNKNPIHSISLDITVYDNSKLDINKTKLLDKALENIYRNPFEVLVDVRGNINKFKDLTTKYKLDGISKDDKNIKALIKNKGEYEVGDYLDGMKIIDISIANGVELRRDKEKYLIKFR